MDKKVVEETTVATEDSPYREAGREQRRNMGMQ